MQHYDSQSVGLSIGIEEIVPNQKRGKAYYHRYPFLLSKQIYLWEEYRYVYPPP
jgi:hypothetical protein